MQRKSQEHHVVNVDVESCSIDFPYPCTRCGLMPQYGDRDLHQDPLNFSPDGSHYLNQCWLIITITEVLVYSHDSSYTGNTQGIQFIYEFESYKLKITAISPIDQWENTQADMAIRLLFDFQILIYLYKGILEVNISKLTHKIQCLSTWFKRQNRQKKYQIDSDPKYIPKQVLR